jgi:hypothetical protein
MFDIDGDGIADDTSWIGASEGFLFLDRDRNGTVSGIAELSFIDDAPDAHSDLEGLRAFDSNADGMLSADDVRFSDFRVWQDRNGDGIAENAEVLSLLQANVRSINLAASATEAEWAFGSTAIVNRGLYTRTDGSTMEYVDAALTQASTPQPPAATVADSPTQTPVNSLASALETLAAAPAASIGDWLAQSMPAGAGDNRLTARDGGGGGSNVQIPASWPASMAADAGSKSARAEGDSDRLLALMRQDMSAFGSKVGDADLNWRKPEASRPMDFFA